MFSASAAATLISAALIVTLAGLSCSSTPEAEPEKPPMSLADEMAAAPDWVLRGCAAPSARGTAPSLCGVGSMGLARNVTRARMTAVVRARTEIARSLETRLRAILEDYHTTPAGGAKAGSNSANELGIVDVSRQITEMSLPGTRLEQVWISPANTVFALVILDLARFKQSLSRMTNLPEPIRQAVEQRSAAAFGETERNVAPKSRQDTQNDAAQGSSSTLH